MFLLEKQIMRDEMSFLSKYDLKKRISQLSLANIYANERKRQMYLRVAMILHNVGPFGINHKMNGTSKTV